MFGSSAGLRFKLWYEYYRKFDGFIHTLIDSGVMSLNFAELNKTEQLIFVISSCYYAKEKSLETKNYIFLENLCKFLKKFKIPQEMQVIALHNSFSFDLIAKEKLYKCSEFFELFKGLSENLTFKK